MLSERRAGFAGHREVDLEEDLRRAGEGEVAQDELDPGQAGILRIDASIRPESVPSPR